MRRGQEEDSLNVQVEAGNSHDGVEEVMLIRHEEPSSAAKGKASAQVGGIVPFKGSLVETDHWKVLDIRIVLLFVRHEMVHVVRRLPPANRDAKEECDDPVAVREVVLVVTHIVAKEGQLLPKETQTHGGCEWRSLEK